MRHPNVLEAFAILLDELNTALKNTREQAAAATQKGNYDEAEAQLAEARQIEKYIADVRVLRREWAASGRKPRHNRTVAGARLSRGERTPEAAYRLPILRALVALGGEAKMSQALEKVYGEMKPRLRQVDLEPLPSDSDTPRWRNTAPWERPAMVDEGLLRKDSPRGVWAITDLGRKTLAQHSR